MNQSPRGYPSTPAEASLTPGADVSPGAPSLWPIACFALIVLAVSLYAEQMIQPGDTMATYKIISSEGDEFGSKSKTLILADHHAQWKAEGGGLQSIWLVIADDPTSGTVYRMGAHVSTEYAELYPDWNKAQLHAARATWLNSEHDDLSKRYQFQAVEFREIIQ